MGITKTNMTLGISKNKTSTEAFTFYDVFSKYTRKIQGVLYALTNIITLKKSPSY